MKNRGFRNNNSGQVIVVTALMVALVLLSSAIFVIGTEKDVPTATNSANSFFSAYQQAARNTLISALANLTNSGNTGVLAADFSQLESAIAANSYQSILQMNFVPLNEAPYQNGFYVSWGTNGQGISSACVTCEINSTGTDSTSNLETTIEATSQVDLSGTYIQLDNNSMQINLTISLSNDGLPALAETISLNSENANRAWISVLPPSITDFGNGTYTTSFTEQTDQLFFPLQVSAVCQDQRGIVTMANTTCTSVG